MTLQPLNLKALWKLAGSACEGMAWGFVATLSLILSIYAKAYTESDAFVALIMLPIIVAALYIIKWALKAILAAFDIGNGDDGIEIFTFMTVCFAVVCFYQDKLGPQVQRLGVITVVALGLMVMFIGWGFFVLYGFLIFKKKLMPHFRLEQSHIDALISTDPVFSLLKVRDDAWVRGWVPGTQKVVLTFDRWGARGVLGEINIELLPQPTIDDVWKYIKHPKLPKLPEQQQAA